MSRYNNSEKIVHRGRETKAVLKHYPWLITKPSQELILTFKVTTQTAGAPRRIANQVYGNHNLWWVIALFNNRWYTDPGSLQVLNWPVAGQIIYYPEHLVIATTI